MGEGGSANVEKLACDSKVTMALPATTDNVADTYGESHLCNGKATVHLQNWSPRLSILRPGLCWWIIPVLVRFD